MERRTLAPQTAYEHTCTYRYHVGREGIPIPWSGLELPNGSRAYRERPFLDAFPCPMGGFRTTGRKRYPSLVLVLEHRRKRADVPVFYFPAGSYRHTGLPSKLAYLHSQFDADSETQVRFHRCRAFATPTRSRLESAVSNWPRPASLRCGYDFSAVGSAVCASSSST